MLNRTTKDKFYFGSADFVSNLAAPHKKTDLVYNFLIQDFRTNMTTPTAPVGQA